MLAYASLTRLEKICDGRTQAPSIFLLDVLLEMNRRFLFATHVADPVQNLL